MIEGQNISVPASPGGTKNDAGKTRLELFPGDALFAISQVLTFGAQKYADRNWEKGISWGRVYGALMRHMWSWWQGRGPTNKSFLFGDLDEESSLSHLWHAGCCLVFLISYEMRGQTSFDDRPAYQKGMPTTQGVGTPNYGGSGLLSPQQGHAFDWDPTGGTR